MFISLFHAVLFIYLFSHSILAGGGGTNTVVIRDRPVYNNQSGFAEGSVQI